MTDLAEVSQRLLRAIRRWAGLLLVGSTLCLPACSTEEATPEETGLWFYVLVKSSNYAQDANGELTLLNYHFFSEIFPKPGFKGGLRGELQRQGSSDAPMVYVDRGKDFYFEGGHFDSVAEADEAYPNGVYDFAITNDRVEVRASMTLGDANGETDIPAPIRISLLQDDSLVSPLAVDHEKDLRVVWSDYSNGAADANGIVDDMIFVVVQNCQGERIVHTGLPFQNADYMTFREKELLIEGGTLKPGEPYAMFVEFPHVVDSSVAAGVPGFTSFATATYLDIETTGETIDSACLAEMPAMDTGQTDRPAQH